MGVIAAAIRAAERAPIPDGLTLAGIDWLCGRNRKRLAATPADFEQRFISEMDAYPIAVHTEDFLVIPGPRMVDIAELLQQNLLRFR